MDHSEGVKFHADGKEGGAQLRVEGLVQFGEVDGRGERGLDEREGFDVIDAGRGEVPVDAKAGGEALDEEEGRASEREVQHAIDEEGGRAADHGEAAERR